MMRVNLQNNIVRQRGDSKQSTPANENKLRKENSGTKKSIIHAEHLSADLI